MKKISIFLTILCSLVLLSCKKEQKAFEKAMASRSIYELDAYLKEFMDDAPIENIAIAGELREYLYEDSVFYSEIAFIEDITERYNKATEYLKLYSEGNYINKAESEIENCKHSIVGKYTKLFDRYKYFNKTGTLFGVPFGEYFYFYAPNREGKGIGEFINTANWNTDVIPISYEILFDEDIVKITITYNKRTLDLIANIDNYYMTFVNDRKIKF